MNWKDRLTKIRVGNKIRINKRIYYYNKRGSIYSRSNCAHTIAGNMKINEIDGQYLRLSTYNTLWFKIEDIK